MTAPAVMDVGGAAPSSLVAVVQRPGHQAFAIYDESLLRDPAGRNRDIGLYLAERHAAGDTRILAIDNSAHYAPDKSGAWVAHDDNRPHVQWTNAQGLWSYHVLR